MVPCMFLILPCMSFCGAAWWGLQLQWSCVHAVQSVARGKCQKEYQAYRSLGQGQTQADIVSVVSLLTQQPRALQKHARLLVTMQKRILGQRPAGGTRCAMLNTETSHVQRLKRQICSLWSSTLIIESLPLVIVWRAVMARVSPKTLVLSVSSQTTSVLLNVAEIHTIGYYAGNFRASVLDK